MKQPSAEHTRFIQELDRAIYSCVCPYCGAQPQQQCISKSRKIGLAAVHSPTPHIDRVKAGHLALKK